MSVAYLLARASDTIADTKVVARRERLEILQQFRDGFVQDGRPPDVRGALAAVYQSLARFAECQVTTGEKVLLERLDDCFEMLAGLSESDQALVAAMLRAVISGEIFDHERFPGESESELVAVRNPAELDEYMYLVAGSVGEFWTRMCAAHVAELAHWQDGRMDELSRQFGKGLQLVNVLRDIPKDLRMGRCYLPVAEPRALLDPGDFAAFCPIYDQWLDTAVAQLDAGWQYARQLPVCLPRLRLACTWPLWIGLQTVALLRHANPLDPARPVKLARGTVYRLMAWSVAVCCNNAALEAAFRQLRAQALAARLDTDS